jgi:hypothetical protein
MSGSMQTGSGTPIVTEGAAGSRQPYGDFFSAYERMQQLRQPQSSGGFFDMTPAQQSALDRLGALGAAMASTRSPTFAGALGEGLQAMQRTAASQRQEERQNRQTDMEAAYRAASEARQLREILNREDPNSLQGQELMARIRQLNEQANYYARRPSGEGRSRGNFVEMVRTMPDGSRQVVWYNATTGETRAAPPDLQRPRSPEEEYRRLMLEDQRYLNAYSLAERIIQNDPLRHNLPPERRRQAVDAETRSILESRPSVVGRQQPQQPGTTTAPTAGGGQRRVISTGMQD